MLVRAGDDRDLADVATMDQARAADARFALRRDVPLIQYSIAKKRMQAGLGPPGARQVEFFVAEEGASAVAYVVLRCRRKDGRSRRLATATRRPPVWGRCCRCWRPGSRRSQLPLDPDLVAAVVHRSAAMAAHRPRRFPRPADGAAVHRVVTAADRGRRFLLARRLFLMRRVRLRGTALTHVHGTRRVNCMARTHPQQRAGPHLHERGADLVRSARLQADASRVREDLPAAFRPGAPMMPPPGCVAAPHR